MSNFITVSRTDSNATHAQRLLSLVQQTKSVLNDGAQLIAEAYQMFGEEGPDKFNEFAEKLGIASADAQAVFDMLNGQQQAMRGTAENAQSVALSTRVG